MILRIIILSEDLLRDRRLDAVKDLKNDGPKGHSPDRVF